MRECVRPRPCVYVRHNSNCMHAVVEWRGGQQGAAGRVCKACLEGAFVFAARSLQPIPGVWGVLAAGLLSTKDPLLQRYEPVLLTGDARLEHRYGHRYGGYGRYGL